MSLQYKSERERTERERGGGKEDQENILSTVLFDMHTHMHTYTHTSHIHTHAHIHTHIHTHAHIYISAAWCIIPKHTCMRVGKT